eukprot:45278-Eustigmatos_ZCMA.PRE.1
MGVCIYSETVTKADDRQNSLFVSTAVTKAERDQHTEVQQGQGYPLFTDSAPELDAGVGNAAAKNPTCPFA